MEKGCISRRRSWPLLLRAVKSTKLKSCTHTVGLLLAHFSPNLPLGLGLSLYRSIGRQSA